MSLVLLVGAVLGLGLWGPVMEGVANQEVAMVVVRYEDFGARGDGRTDDSEAIAKAHAFANQHGLPVRADDKATYYIGGHDQTAIIQTDTDFGSARFIIDDTAVQNVRAHIFEVRSALPSIKLAGVTSLKRNQRRIDVALPGRCVVHATNSGVKHFIRKGKNQNSGSSQNDVFLADANGTIDADTPIQWEFDRITELIAYPMDDQVLTIKGGRFSTIANGGHPDNTYYARGISIKRSNVVVEGLEHRITGEGEKGAPYGGFINISNCANVIVRDTLLTARKTYWKESRIGGTVPMGSYGISISRGLNITLERVRQTNDIHNNRFWGIMGTNFCRNLLLESCSLSRFDAHQGVYNATIRNSTIGHMGVIAIGGGTLLVENTTIKTRHFIGLRPDYGSTWQGEIIIRNCVFAPPNPAGAVLISGSNDGQHDFGYPCYMPERVTIENLRIDDSKAPANYKGLHVFASFNPQWKDGSYKQAFPYTVTREIILKNVTTTSGKPVRVSDNMFMFKDVVVTEERD